MDGASPTAFLNSIPLFSELDKTDLGQVMIIFLLILAESLAFVWRDLFEPYFSFIFLVFLVLLFFATLNTTCIGGKRKENAENQFDLSPAGWMWMCWVVYGFGFTPIVFQEVARWIQDLVVLAVVVVSMYPFGRSKQVVAVLVSVLLLLLFLPTENSLSTQMSWVLFLAKTILFCVTYLCSNSIVATDRSLPSRKAEKKEPLLASYNIQMSFVHSFWTLFVSPQFLLLAVLVVIYTFTHGRQNKQERTELPTVKPAVAEKAPSLEEIVDPPVAATPRKKHKTPPATAAPTTPPAPLPPVRKQPKPPPATPPATRKTHKNPTPPPSKPPSPPPRTSRKVNKTVILQEEDFDMSLINKQMF